MNNKIKLRVNHKNLITLRIKTGGEPKRDYYEGPYVVVPQVIEQTLETAEKIMQDDVTVTEIPYAETSNPHGTTVTIAS